LAAKSWTSSGITYASTTDAAPAATACSEGYEGERGIGSTVDNRGSIWPGRRRPWTYFESQAAMVASWMATLTRVIIR
jgi:hypothetical protein